MKSLALLQELRGRSARALVTDPSFAYQLDSRRLHEKPVSFLFSGVKKRLFASCYGIIPSKPEK